MSTRTSRILALARGQSLVFLPKWESKKGTTSHERNVALSRLKMDDHARIQCPSISSSTSDSIGGKTNLKQHEVQSLTSLDRSQVAEPIANAPLHLKENSGLFSSRHSTRPKRNLTGQDVQDLTSSDATEDSPLYTEQITSSDEYVPSHSGLSSDDDSSYIKEEEIRVHNYKAGNNEEEKLNTDISTPLTNHNTRYDLDFTNTGNEDDNQDLLALNEAIDKSDVGSYSSKTNELNHINKKQNPLKKHIRSRDLCFFCETEVLNFARHVIRNHPFETEVQKIQNSNAKSKERRHLLALLKKKGNYLKNANTVVEPFKPRKKSYLPSKRYLPCVHCLGFYVSSQLHRHTRNCSENPNKIKTSLGDSLSKLTQHLKIDENLRKQVFPHMRADKISLTAQRDRLICAFGARYLRLHREKHFISVVSRKMRELSRILIEIRKHNTSINSLFDALNPKYFDYFVDATKKVSKYDSLTESYGAPTFAMNISGSLKQCCDIAINYALKKQEHYSYMDSEDAIKSLKIMIHLFEANWRFEISNQAGSDLNLKKWNKITIIPLAHDLRKLKNYLCEIASQAVTSLMKNQSDKHAYSVLLHTVYCRLLLLNRKRPGELQRMNFDTYNNNERGTYEEFSSVLSPTEKILINKFKRVIIRGKRGRGVPVLIIDEIQNHIDLLIRRRKDLVHPNNPYFFASPNNKISSLICGYKILQKFANKCGAKNPSALTSTRLRKHLATLSQIFNMNDSELEQLSTFMGHTLNVHKNSYRLPDDIYQTAKVSKLLVLMETGNIESFKGKTLNEINVNLEEDLLDDAGAEETQNEISVDLEDLQTNNLETEERGATIEEECLNKAELDQDKNKHLHVASTEKLQAKVKRHLVKWTDKQKQLAKEFFKKKIDKKKPPKRNECENLKSQFPEVFYNKDWKKIKVFIQNEYTRINCKTYKSVNTA